MREDEEKEIEERFDREMKEFLDEMAAGLGVDIEAKLKAELGDIEEDEEEDAELFAGIDALVEHIRSLPPVEKVSIVNEKRLREIGIAYSQIKRVLRETLDNPINNATIRCYPYEFDMGIGVIRVEGSPLSVVDTEGFATVAGLADNMEIYPLEVNKLRMAYMFYGLLTKIGEIE